MTQLQIFKKDDSNLEQYLDSIRMWVHHAMQNNLISNFYLDLLFQKISGDISNWKLFPRQDLLNFWENIFKIISDIIYIEEFRKICTKISNSNKQDLEKSFDIVSAAQDFIDEIKSKEEIKKQQLLQQQKFEKMKESQVQEAIDAQQKLDELLNNL